MSKPRVLITRPRQQADHFAEDLIQAGLEPIFFPVIEIQPILDNPVLQHALLNLADYDWVIFTSVNGVEVVWSAMQRMNLDNFPSPVRIAAIGPKTAEALESHEIHADFVPQEYIAEAIVPGLGKLNGQKVLLLRAEIARKALPEAIRAAGGSVIEVSVYKTVPARLDAPGLLALHQGVDVITLTSSSTVQNFIALVTAAGLDPLHLAGNPLFACIGPVTEQTAREVGLPNLLTASEYTTAGLIQAIRIWLER